MGVCPSTAVVPLLSKHERLGHTRGAHSARVGVVRLVDNIEECFITSLQFHALRWHAWILFICVSHRKGAE